VTAGGVAVWYESTRKKKSSFKPTRIKMFSFVCSGIALGVGLYLTRLEDCMFCAGAVKRMAAPMYSRASSGQSEIFDVRAVALDVVDERVSLEAMAGRERVPAVLIGVVAV